VTRSSRPRRRRHAVTRSRLPGCNRS